MSIYVSKPVSLMTVSLMLQPKKFQLFHLHQIRRLIQTIESYNQAYDRQIITSYITPSDRLCCNTWHFRVKPRSKPFWIYTTTSERRLDERVPHLRSESEAVVELKLPVIGSVEYVGSQGGGGTLLDYRGYPCRHGHGGRGKGEGEAEEGEEEEEIEEGRSHFRDLLLAY